MEINKFIEDLKEILEAEKMTINVDTLLKSIPEYDSLAILSIIAYIDENFSKKLSTQEFNNLKTVGDLIHQIGDENFNK
jgi:acyl carrier protein